MIQPTVELNVQTATAPTQVNVNITMRITNEDAGELAPAPYNPIAALINNRQLTRQADGSYASELHLQRNTVTQVIASELKALSGPLPRTRNNYLAQLINSTKLFNQ